MLINGEEHNDLCVGIDLGTTNSVLATVNVKPNGDIVSKVIALDDAVDMFTTAKGAKFMLKKNSILPSCVYYNEEKNYTPIVGSFAKGRYPLRPHLVAKSIKSQMGNAFAEGLLANIPDKTPAQISARILKHMLTNAAKIFHLERIDDAVITVPANFDPIMRQATLEAAKLAGIKISKADGTPRQVLLSEPRAVIYDFINQVRNGEIADIILDLNSKKNVMVFDLGGGTLDITLHEISRRKDAPEILSVQDIATNRYTLLGGDDFDLCLAKTMFEHYQRQYSAYSDILQKIRHEERAVMSQLLTYAENLKLDVSTQKSGAFGGNDSGWWEDEDFPVGGTIGATGFAYDDLFTTAQLEDIWRDFMGEELQFDDYKNADAVAAKFGNRKNIILPIIDVLSKAAAKLGTQDVKVDAVIMNGGMSRFYMVINRLKTFFGFDPIVALDPDQAVARGAAVYHYFLHKYDKELADEPIDKLPDETPNQQKISEQKNKIFIDIIGTVTNESFYLVLDSGNIEEIIPAGKDLPYTSKRFTGFKLKAGKRVASVPIARREPDGTYRIIAKGTITFPEKYSRIMTLTYVTFSISMNEDKIIRMEAATCRDAQGQDIMDRGTAEISIDSGVKTGGGPAKFIPPTGGYVNPKTQLNTIRNLCRKIDDAFKKKDHGTHSKLSATLRDSIDLILKANNREEFADLILEKCEIVQDSNEETFKERCIVIARKLNVNWTPQQKRRLARICLHQLNDEIHNPGIFFLKPPGWKMNTKIQAIYTLSMCGDEDDLAQLVNLHGNLKLRQACLYTHAITKTEIYWIYEEFRGDYMKVLDKKTKSNIQISAHALGASFKLDGRPINSNIRRDKIVSELCRVIRSQNLNNVELSVCLLAIGLLCDRRTVNDIAQKSFAEVEKLFNELPRLYAVNTYIKAQSVAQKMIQGSELTPEEEESLLMKCDT